MFAPALVAVFSSLGLCGCGALRLAECPGSVKTYPRLAAPH